MNSSNYPAGVSQKDIDKLCPGNGDYSDVERMATIYSEAFRLYAAMSLLLDEDFTDPEAEKICRQSEDALAGFLFKIKSVFPHIAKEYR